MLNFAESLEKLTYVSMSIMSAIYTKTTNDMTNLLFNERKKAWKIKVSWEQFDVDIFF